MPGRRTKAQPGEQKCGQPTTGSNGGPCARPAGFGTDHPGTGPCRRHGGGTARGIKRIASKELESLLGEPVDVDPSEALLFCVALASQEVKWIREQLAYVTEPTHLAPQGNLGGPQKGMVGMQEEFDIWIQAQQYAVDRLARYSKMALDAGVAERMVNIAEKLADYITPLLQGVLGDLGLSGEQRKRAPEVVGRHLRLLEARAGGSIGGDVMPFAPKTKEKNV
jgi:hypothetical protein